MYWRNLVASSKALAMRVASRRFLLLLFLETYGETIARGSAQVNKRIVRVGQGSRRCSLHLPRQQ